ncbi:MAG: type II toxin-antitoxin system RelE/ParE family toxin [Lactobacillaceae bacterium]|jgi:mRNA interferase RelE/StbE|nr:type II toxin-antitoxin system RelE/ParE family toxin [Lactobacillaceae bacterium]
MSKYVVDYADTFYESASKIDKGTLKIIKKWIEKHLVDVDFPNSPGKKLESNLAGYVRFRIGSYRLIAIVDDDKFVITNVFVAKREIVYKKFK